jgi:hypothetical protein
VLSSGDFRLRLSPLCHCPASPSADQQSQSFFGTAFFADSADRIRANPQLWIYWVVTIPLTGLVFVIWFFLKKRRDARRALDPDEEGAARPVF